MNIRWLEKAAAYGLIKIAEGGANASMMDNFKSFDSPPAGKGMNILPDDVKDTVQEVDNAFSQAGNIIQPMEAIGRGLDRYADAREAGHGSIYSGAYAAAGAAYDAGKDAAISMIPGYGSYRKGKAIADWTTVPLAEKMTEWWYGD